MPFNDDFEQEELSFENGPEDEAAAEEKEQIVSPKKKQTKKAKKPAAKPARETQKPPREEKPAKSPPPAAPEPASEKPEITVAGVEVVEKKKTRGPSLPKETAKAIIEAPVEEQMKSSYIDYSMSVIVGRALPDVRDGLKPVHRRILYAMDELGLQPGKPYKKSARIVGDTLGRYHPHGDSAVYESMVRMAQDFSLRYLLVDGQGNFGCFTGDTKIRLADGRALSFLDLIEEDRQGKKNFAFTFNRETQKIELAEILKPRRTREMAELIKITLDNGEEIRCTINHRFMLRDGTYKEAQLLTAGDSLMPLYSRFSTAEDDPNMEGYAMLYQPGSESWAFAHHLADQWNIQNSIYPKSAGRIRHHKDFNKLNNDPYNIVRMHWEEHWRVHHEFTSEKHKTDAEYREKLANGRKQYWSQKENREAHAKALSKRNHRNWKDPGYREKRSAAIKKRWEDFAYRAFMAACSSLNLRAKWEDEAFRNRAGAKKSLELKKKWQNQEYAEHMTEVTRKTSRRIWADPAHRERMTKISKARWEDKAYRERMREQSKKNWQSEKYKAFMAESYRKKWRSDPDFRNKFLPILAENGKKSHYYRFLRVCEKALHENFWLSDDTYETARENYGSRNGEGIVRFDKAINKYFNGEMSKFFEVFCERIRTAQQGNATLNHKVVKAEKLSEREDVYDLTIDGTHNFALGSGVFVHNSVDGDSAAAMRYCVSGDTRVVTADGLLQIEKIPHNSPINTDVLSMNNKINRATEWFDSGEHETRTIETFRGLSLTGSLNHPLLTWQKGEGGKPQFKWKLLKEIVEGDFAVISRSPLLFPAEEPALEAFFPMRKHRRQEHLLPRRMTPELAFLLGAIVAEGNIGEKQIGFCNNDQEFIEQFKAGFKKVFPDCRLHEFVRRPQGFTRKPYTSLEIHSLQVIEFLNNLGLVRGRAKTRQVPEIIFASTKNSMAAFLRGYAEGGGSVYKSTDLSLLEITFISVSKKLMQEMQLLLLRFGIDSSSRWQRTRNTFKLFIRGQVNLNLFMEQINFATQRKKEKLQEIAARNASAWVMSKMDFVPFLADYLRQRTCYRGQSGWLTKHNLDRYPKIDKHWGKLLQILAPEDRQLYQALKANKYIFDKIVLVKAGPKQKVFSIKVASPCHSFVSNGFISHNTEARLGKIAVEMLSDIEKDTVDFGPNFDESLQEPLVLPSRVPNLLINGSSGIAVGMATNIPPHNLSEVADGVNALIENPEMSVADLMKHIKGPDFPTGALICGKAGIKSALETGRGSIVLRAKTQIEETRGGKQAIIVTEIPYQVNKADLIETIANLVKDKKIKGISDLRDESDRSGMRIFIETRRDANVNIVLNQLFKHTNLQISFGVNMVALVDGVPVQLNLKQALQEYIKHRQKVVTRRAKFELKKAEELAHILEGLLIAVSNIDKIVALIRKSKDPAEAKAGLMKSFKLSEIQAQAILDLKLQRLTQLERHKIDEEYKATKARIKELKELLASEKKILGVVAKETAEVKEKYGDERKSKIIAEVGEVSEEELIQDVEVAVLLTRDGYIKRMPLSAFKAQLRGGRGVAGMATREEDEIDKIFVATTLSYLLFFTNKGKVYKIKAYELPEASRAGKGQSIANVLELGMGEVVTAAISAKNFDTKTFLFMATRNGVVKKTDMEAFANIRRTGIAAIKLKGEDELRWVKETDGKQEIVMGTKTGLMIRFSEKLVRPMGRAAAGVKGISLRKGDNVVSMDIVEKDADLLAVSASGFGKRMKVEEFSAQNRGGKGHIAIKLRKDDEVAKMMLIHKDDELLFVSSKGTMMRQKASGISTQGRYAKGVRLQRLDEGDYLVDLARVVKAEEEMGEQGAGKE